ncbi:hypothetical protein KNV00_gp095 [Streptomyces phage Bmoc]|uniref:Uncharacterized protein n=1 Tax=Streptomyces phage Bmoc TaxID=2725629 RepID=A0A6M3TAT0_9CAUD|nr:hypothetical protein KNV00_gp095 [Streptomyces phage Bmoc]QJD50924.1 hypothetical protein SEA_BMOC_215 [Streptomyces phage Bmoc]
MATGEGPKLVSYYEWWYCDIEEFVKNLWGDKAKWEGGAAMYFPAQDTYHDVDVDGGWVGEGYDGSGKIINTRWLTEDLTYEEGKAIIDRFREHGMPREEGASPSVELLLNWLAFENIIPTGKYRVTVYW